MPLPWWPLGRRPECSFATVSGKGLVHCVGISLSCFSTHICKVGSWGCLSLQSGEDFTLERKFFCYTILNWVCPSFLRLDSSPQSPSRVLLCRIPLSPLGLIFQFFFFFFIHGYFFSSYWRKLNGQSQFLHSVKSGRPTSLLGLIVNASYGLPSTHDFTSAGLDEPRPTLPLSLLPSYPPSLLYSSFLPSLLFFFFPSDFLSFLSSSKYLLSPYDTPCHCAEHWRGGEE